MHAVAEDFQRSKVVGGPAEHFEALALKACSSITSTSNGVGWRRDSASPTKRNTLFAKLCPSAGFGKLTAIVAPPENSPKEQSF
jgi:hypothetical protein